MMQDIHLNFARKWRSRTFDQIVGQELSVKILKNSLFLGHFFPVYLFSGQRGCGKTTTARVFAAAVNCAALEKFQQDPRAQEFPCLQCTSCQAMSAGKHPDFIEIDAASHTGVDNVRQIVDASSFLPLLGRKRIYLIDEAHMLSKAAFNAFLKVLEEPVSTVLFMLATTDPQKILETVKSRSFQLFFSAIEVPKLSKHLQEVCAAEKIAYDIEALTLIVQSCQGSARDALNMLEQLRLSHEKISKEAVLSVLRQPDEHTMFELLEVVLSGDTARLLLFVRTRLHNVASAEALWYSFLQFVRAALWAKYDLVVDDNTVIYEKVRPIVAMHSAEYICALLESMYEHEVSFLKTTAQLPLFEVILLKMQQKLHKKDAASQAITKKIAPVAEKKEDELIAEPVVPEVTAVAQQPTSSHDGWQNFLHSVEKLNDQLLKTLFKQARFAQHDTENLKIHLVLAKNFSVFADSFDSQKHVWQPLLIEHLGQGYSIEIAFEGQEKKNTQPIERVTEQKIEKRPAQQVKVVQKPFIKKSSAGTTPLKNKVDVSDATTWKVGSALVRAFPGAVTELGEGDHE